MIQNVVFDIGNVLVSYRPDVYLSKFVEDQEEIAYFQSICFGSEEWLAGERGLMDRGDIIEAICRKHPREAQRIRAIMEPCDSMLCASASNTAVVKKLYEAGIGTYYLSNTNDHAFQYMVSTHAFFQYMNGGVVSYEHGILKPSYEIFHLFLDCFSLPVESCVFVDDSPLNTRAAADVGFQTVTLSHINDLREELSRFPVLTALLND